MGYGEVGGNQSVHWKMVHENTLRPTRSPKGPGKGARLLSDDDERYHDQIRGRDPIAYEEIGRKGGHPGKFRVTLRFDSLKEAREAGVADKVVKQGRYYFLIVDVPARFRYDPETNPPFEVRVRW